VGAEKKQKLQALFDQIVPRIKERYFFQSRNDSRKKGKQTLFIFDIIDIP
jgi:hypothetical protein